MVVEKKKPVDKATVKLVTVESYYTKSREVYPTLNAWEGATILIESEHKGKIIRIITRAKSGVTYYIVEE